MIGEFRAIVFKLFIADRSHDSSVSAVTRNELNDQVSIF